MKAVGVTAAGKDVIFNGTAGEGVIWRTLELEE